MITHELSVCELLVSLKNTRNSVCMVYFNHQQDNALEVQLNLIILV